jgi:putative FmdB family regulatory protein
MPTYEYQCKTCGHHFERVQRFADDPIKVCPECGAEVRRVIHPAGVIFKGAGWYITDSRKGGGDSASLSKTNGAKSEGDAAAKSDSTESKPAETAAKAEKAPASSES